MKIKLYTHPTSEPLVLDVPSAKAAMLVGVTLYGTHPDGWAALDESGDVVACSGETPPWRQTAAEQRAAVRRHERAGGFKRDVLLGAGVSVRSA